MEVLQSKHIAVQIKVNGKGPLWRHLRHRLAGHAVEQ